MSQDGKQTQGVDLGDFLEFYLLDSQEQIEKLGSGLLQLEKEGGNITIINDLFRSAHSLKGASGTMGFTPIVHLTHAAEDLLDRLRQGKIEVSFELIDVLLGVTDRVKAMLAQVEKRVEIDIEYEDLVQVMKDLAEGLIQGDANTKSNEAEKQENTSNDEEQVFKQLDFRLSSEERDKVHSSLMMGRGLYQVDVTLAPNTLMKAVRAVMAVQKIESMGTLVKIVPSIDELESSTTDSFSFLVITDERPEELREEVLGVSELAEVIVNSYTYQDEEGNAQSEIAAAAVVLEQDIEAETIVTNKEDKSSNDFTNKSKTDESKAKMLEGVQPIRSATPSGTSSQAQGIEGNNQVHTIRVDTARMDNLINLVGEMVITRTRLVQIGLDLKEQNRMNSLVNNLNETNVYLGRLMNDLQESVMRLRMVPIGTVFSRFPRLVRDLCRKMNKDIDLVLKGEDTELDKTVVEVIGDPLMHLIRNAVDHGIETIEKRREAGKPEKGTITLDAYHEGNHIAIIISDDGSGLPLAKIKEKAINKGLIGEREELSDRDIANLIFLPGFSTADQITDISGRGVGMDVVKKSLNNLGGMIDIQTDKGKGTRFIIRLPLTLAIIQALLVEVGGEIYAVPLSSVLETLLVDRSEIKTVGGLPMVQLRGNTLPLISLQERFDLPPSEEKPEEVFVVVVGLGEKALGLVVDSLKGQQEIVIKSLGDFLSNLPGIAGATILGDGKVTLILDVGSMIQDVLVMNKVKS